MAGFVKAVMNLRVAQNAINLLIEELLCYEERRMKNEERS